MIKEKARAKVINLLLMYVNKVVKRKKPLFEADVRSAVVFYFGKIGGG